MNVVLWLFGGTMQVWPEIINKAKEGGLDVIETYVFWNYHEPVKGQVYITLAFDVDSLIVTLWFTKLEI